MKVILLEKINKLGLLGETVNVRSGYARNFLIPHAKATEATAVNLAKFEERRADIEKHQAAILADAQARAEKLDGVKIDMSVKAGSEGRLFGSVTSQDIADAFTNAGVKVSKSEVRITNGAIRAIGEHPVALHLHAEVNIQIQVNVVPE
ncbi:50S ribosomal subunit protein L9 [Gammaproteobacteria bacterium]|nr:50S ribosomal subunit protein L9 [Gammaproteobacteria bacterium]